MKAALALAKKLDLHYHENDKTFHNAKKPGEGGSRCPQLSLNPQPVAHPSDSTPSELMNLPHVFSQRSRLRGNAGLNDSIPLGLMFLALQRRARQR
ncbi:MAG: hypothetical protein KGJ60_08110 [Verrucomicrobiota bacterium]|nr:hypothetical protein [Verrucomicrobiota bacterium]